MLRFGIVKSYALLVKTLLKGSIDVNSQEASDGEEDETDEPDALAARSLSADDYRTPASFVFFTRNIT